VLTFSDNQAFMVIGFPPGSPNEAIAATASQQIGLSSPSEASRLRSPLRAPGDGSRCSLDRALELYCH
jgi:hypothetical protein